MEDHAWVSRTAAQPATSASEDQHSGLLLIGVAIVLTGLNLRTAVTSVGPVLQEIEDGLGISSGLAGLVTTMPVLCFAAIGFAGPGLSARFRDSHVLSGALATMAAGLVVRAVAPTFWLFLLGTVLAMVGGALGNVLLPSLVKRYFPGRTGLMVGAYSTAMSVGATIAAVSSAPAGGGGRSGCGRSSRCSRPGPGSSSGPIRGSPAARTSPSGCGTSGTAAWPWRSWSSSASRASRPTSSSAGRPSTSATPA
jgi:MFS family permease